MNKNWRNIGLLISIFAISIFLSIRTQGIFISSRNIINLMRQVSVNGILAIGMTMIIITAGIDLSVGSVLAACAVVSSYLQVFQGFNAVSAIIFTIITGALLGAFNGFFISSLNIHPFIITLGMMTIGRGVALIISKGASIAPLDSAYTIIGTGDIPPVLAGVIFVLFCVYHLFKIIKKFKSSGNKLHIFFILGIIIFCIFGSRIIFQNGIPIMALIFFMLAFLVHILLENTKFGRYLYAIGGNREAARLSGINIKKVIFSVFIIMGVLASISGIILSARLNAGTPTLGQMAELDAIASCVIGGTSLMGGVGTITGTILGAFIIGILNNGLSLLNVDTFLQYIFKGIIIIGAVAIDKFKK